MSSVSQINREYFEWIQNLVCGNRYSDSISYRKLLKFLHGTEFTYFVPRDENRAKDGVDLRYRFCDEAYERINKPCSVLEMMVALALRCEETIMDDPAYGNRTGQWFWGMIASLGLGGMYDTNFDLRYSEIVISKFLAREYYPNGKGGLFTVRNSDVDMRTKEIWWQLCCYLNGIA